MPFPEFCNHPVIRPHLRRQALSSNLDELNAKSLTIYGIQEQVPTRSKPENYYTGAKIEIPADSFYSFTATAMFNNASASWIGISTSETEVASSLQNANAGLNHASCSRSGWSGPNGATFYICARYSSEADNTIFLDGFYIIKE